MEVVGGRTLGRLLRDEVDGEGCVRVKGGADFIARVESEFINLAQLKTDRSDVLQSCALVRSGAARRRRPPANQTLLVSESAGQRLKKRRLTSSPTTKPSRE